VGHPSTMTTEEIVTTVAVVAAVLLVVALVKRATGMDPFDRVASMAVPAMPAVAGAGGVV